MKRITYQVPTVKGTATRECYRIHLKVGDKRRTFALQFDGEKPCILADYASGYRLADLRVLRLTGYRGAQWWVIAQEWVRHAIAVRGLETFNRTLDSVPVLNKEYAE